MFLCIPRKIKSEHLILVLILLHLVILPTSGYVLDHYLEKTSLSDNYEKVKNYLQWKSVGKGNNEKHLHPPGKANLNLFKLKDAPFSGCSNDAYPPKKEDLVPKHIIDLDLPPRQRWTKLIRNKKAHLKNLLTYMESLMVTLLGPRIFKFVNESLPQVAKTLPKPYFEEIQGIAEAGDLSIAQATLYNIFYEVFTVCTSIITEDEQGHILHGRNLDFGLFLGWDTNNHTWFVAELLRPLVVQLEWRRNNNTVFQSVSYTGFIGAITAQKKGKFSFSMDERFSLNGGYIGLLEWIIFKDHKQKWVSFLVRDVMENAESFEEAQNQLSNPRLLAPVYYILSGVKPGEGVIITRYRNSFNLLPLGTSKKGQSSWFLVETNYDHWKNPPFYDDRRTPAINCLMEGGRQNATLKLLYDVLSTRPVLNKLTTYSTLMDTKKGYMETWLRDCPDPCWPW